MTKYKGKIQQIDTAYVQANLVSARSIYSGGRRDVHAHDSDNLSLTFHGEYSRSRSSSSKSINQSLFVLTFAENKIYNNENIKSKK